MMQTQRVRFLGDSEEQKGEESISGGKWKITNANVTYDKAPAQPSGAQADISKIDDRFQKPFFNILGKEWKWERDIIWIYYPNR